MSGTSTERSPSERGDAMSVSRPEASTTVVDALVPDALDAEADRDERAF
jgi:hypothetical protein